jgi:hypothetical protein
VLDAGPRAYPAVLLDSADHDDRVDPMHARKLAAALQAAQRGDAPILLRIERNAGHGGRIWSSNRSSAAPTRWASSTGSCGSAVRNPDEPPTGLDWRTPPGVAAGGRVRAHAAVGVRLCYHSGMRLAVLVCVLLLAPGCPHGVTPRAAGREPTVAEVVDRLTRARRELRSFTGEAVMEYWRGDDRFKGDVLAMGEVGARVRIAALSPAGGAPLAEMACDGARFVSINYQSNCVLTGPCTKQSIASFFGIELTPDDFLHLALGTPPLVDQPRGTVSWDADKGLHRVALEGPGGKQVIAIDGRDDRWDVVASALVASDGTPVWSVQNAGFDNAKDPEGKDHRVPGRSHFVTPNQQKADLTVEWRERTVNVTIDPRRFVIEVPAGLPTCGHAASPARP